MLKLIPIAVAALALSWLPSSLAASGTAAAAPPAAPATTLRPVVTVASAQVRLGDIFANAGTRQNDVVASAPSPDAPLVLDAPVLARLARANGLDWQPGSAADRTVIERQGMLVDPASLARHVRQALLDNGADLGDAQVTFTGLTQPLRLPADAELVIENLTYRPPGRRFSAILAASVNGQVLRRSSLAGEITRRHSVPVPNRRIDRGTVLMAEDVDWVERPQGRLVASHAVAPDQVVGMVARRDLLPGTPIVTQDLGRLTLVQKNSLVTISLAQPGMQLSARGKALQDGGRGDVVRVANLQSKTVIQGVVTAAGTVSVVAPASVSGAERSFR